MYRIKENTIALYTIVRREVTRFIRIWSQTLLPSVITMGLYFVIFGHLMGDRIGSLKGFRYIDYIVPGLIIMSMITNAYANVVASFFGSKFQRNLEEMLVSPMPNGIILWGFILGGLLRGVVVGVLVTGLSLCFSRLLIQQVGLMALIAVLTSLLFSIAGFINGIFAKKFDDINIVPTFILTPLTYLGGVFYSMDLLPDFWQKVSYVNPIFYMVNAFRFATLGHSDISVELSVWMIVIFTALLYGWALWLLERGVGIKS
jgi:ABC-2 type transport system permease protein